MKKIIETPHAPAPIGPYNQAVILGNLLYTSGQIPMYLETGMVETKDITKATKMVMNYLKVILDEAKLNFEHVLKVSIFVKDMNDFQTINEIYATYFNEATAPARETVQVARLPKDAPIEISLIASLDA
jgi:2-iminobutanoate/2-iminopropanoate deaminase